MPFNEQIDEIRVNLTSKHQTIVHDWSDGFAMRIIAQEFTRENMFDLCEAMLLSQFHGMANYRVFANHKGGVMRLFLTVFVEQLLGDRPAVVDFLYSAYGFTAETMPPVLLMRELLVHQTELRDCFRLLNASLRPDEQLCVPDVRKTASEIQMMPREQIVALFNTPKTT